MHVAAITKMQRREFRVDMQKHRNFQDKGIGFYRSEIERKKPDFKGQMAELREEERLRVAALWRKYGNGKVAQSVERKGKRSSVAFYIAAGADFLLAFAVPYGLVRLGALQPDAALWAALAIFATVPLILTANMISYNKLADKPLNMFDQLRKDAMALFG